MTDEQIKKYFLGELDGAEAEFFEETCAQDAELTEQAQMVETELIDAYLRGELSATEHKSFETNYLITEAREEKVESAKKFLAGIKETLSEPTPHVSFFQTFFGGLQPRLAFVGLLTILLLGGFIFVFLNWQKTDETAKQTTPTPTVTATPKIENPNIQPIENINISNQPTNISTQPNTTTQPNKNSITSPTPEIKKSPSPELKPLHTPKPTEQTAPILASFTLLPGTLRSEGEQFIKLTPNTNKVNLRLNLPKDAGEYQTYNATVKTADGATVSTFSNLKSLNLTLPANKLSNKTYIVFLEGNSAGRGAESVAEYTFKVQR